MLVFMHTCIRKEIDIQQKMVFFAKLNIEIL